MKNKLNKIICLAALIMTKTLKYFVNHFNLNNTLTTLLTISLLTACGSDSKSSPIKKDTHTITNSGSCIANNLTTVKQLISDKGHIIKLVCNGSYIALLMKKYIEFCT